MKLIKWNCGCIGVQASDGTLYKMYSCEGDEENYAVQRKIPQKNNPTQDMSDEEALEFLGYIAGLANNGLDFLLVKSILNR